MPDKKWITRKEILEKTGISGPELDEYIEAGVIPEPVSGGQETQFPGRGIKDVFPASVIWRINLVKRLKQEGESMETIAGQFGDISMIEEMTFPEEKTQRSIAKQNTGFDASSDEAVLRDVEPNAIEPDADEEDPILLENEISPPPAEPPAEGPLTLTLEKIHGPAYLLNNKFEIQWINDDGEKLFFDQKVRAIRFLENRNIFKLLFGSVVQTHLNNWKDFVLLHIPLFTALNPETDLETLYPGISESEVNTLRQMLAPSAAEPLPVQAPDEIRFDRKKGPSGRFQVQTLQFKEGVLYLYQPIPEPIDPSGPVASDKDKIIQRIVREKTSPAVPVCTLAIHLENLDKYADALMPADYFDLFSQVFHAIETCVAERQGIRGGWEEVSAWYHFFELPDTDYMMNALDCAVCLQEKIGAINQQLKKTGRGLGEIAVNIGIAEGTEFAGVLESDGDVDVRVLGATPDQARQLCRFGRNGEIWASKSGIGKMDPDAVRTLAFGVPQLINGRHHHVPNAFSKIKDLGMDASGDSIGEKIAELAVTRIIGIT